MTINTTRWDSAEYLKTEEDVQLYLEACLEEAGDDPAFIAHALGVIARSKVGKADILLDCIEEIRDIPDIHGLNEDPAKLAIILRILYSLGWEIFNPQEVIPEYNIKGTTIKVDYALRVGRRKLFIEAKAPEVILENSQDSQDQLRDYSLSLGEPPPDFAILTNGILWWFYLPTYKDSWRDCKFYTIDILTQEVEDIADKFHLLLYRESIESGIAFEYANRLPKDITQSEGNADINNFEAMLNGQIKNLGKEFVHKTQGQLDNTRYHRWFENKKPWDEFRLSYMVRLEQGGERPSALIGLFYKTHEAHGTPGLSEFNKGLFESVESMVQALKVYEDQRMEPLDSWGRDWKKFKYVYVRRSADSWDDKFANTIAETLRCFVETYTPEIEECWFQCNQQNT